MSNERGNDAAGYLGWFFLGSIAGAATALLLAPKTGRETRELLAERGNEFLKRAQEKAGETQGRLQRGTREGQSVGLVQTLVEVRVRQEAIRPVLAGRDGQPARRVVAVYRTMPAEGPTADELTQAQTKVLARSVVRSERPMGRLASLGFHWAYRREYFSVDQELDAFGRVTLADVRRVLADWPPWPLTIVSVGPTTEVTPPE